MDDEGIVRRSIRAYLEMNGLTVLDCADGSEALKVASELKEKLALLITDVVMPNMTGIELARSLVKQMPELPIIFMSGYAAGEKGHQDFKQATFLQKPFACATMLDTVCKGLQICPSARADSKLSPIPLREKAFVFPAQQPLDIRPAVALQ